MPPCAPCPGPWAQGSQQCRRCGCPRQAGAGHRRRSSRPPLAQDAAGGCQPVLLRLYASSLQPSPVAEDVRRHVGEGCGDAGDHGWATVDGGADAP
eukprot:6300275-Pyramimonas_sp.AAC.1